MNLVNFTLFGQFYNLTLSQCQSVRERPNFSKNWQSSNFDMGFQKKKFQVDLRKSIFWKMTFSREHGLKFYKPFFKSFSRFESWSFFNVKKIKKLKNNRKRFIKRYGTLYNIFLFQTVSHVQVTAPLGDGNGIVTAW